MATLQARRRVGTGKGAARRIRSRGLLPAVLYGNTNESVNLAVDPKSVKELLSTDKGRNAVFALEVDGGETAACVRVRDYAKDPVRRTLLHCDFQRLDETKAINWKVPLRLIGESPAVKMGCKLTFVTRQIWLRCIPSQVPVTVDVDINRLQAGGIIRLDSLQAEDGIEYLWRENAPIVHVSAGAVSYDEDEEEGEDGAEASADAGGGDAAEDSE